MTQTQTQANRNRLLQEIENNDKEIAERDAAATKILQEVTAIGDMMRELDHLAKLQAPMLDSIEANIEQVDEHAKVAVVELREARANQKSCIIS